MVVRPHTYKSCISVTYIRLATATKNYVIGWPINFIMQLLQGTKAPLLPATEATLIFILMATVNFPCYYTNNNAYISEVSAYVYARLTVLHFIVSQQALNRHSLALNRHSLLLYIPLVAAGKCHHCSSIICCCYNAMLLLLHVTASVCKCAYVCVLLYAVLLLVNINTAAVYIICCCDYTILLLLYVAASVY